MVQIQSNRRRWWLIAAKVAIAAAVCVAVGSTLRTAINSLEEDPRRIEISWLVLAGLLYLGGIMPMAWFWWRTLAALGQSTYWPATVHAYVLGHLGKYVPGKALVVVIRVGLLRARINSVRLTMASVLLETLTLMATGAALGAALSGFVLHLDWRVTAVAIFFAIAAALPAIPPVARRLARKAASDFRAIKEEQEANSDSTGAIQLGITFRLLVKGWIAGFVCWAFWGLSLWATLRAIGVDTLSPVYDLPMCVAAVSLSVVGGFVSMLPGGLVVRDALLLELLSPICGPANALLAAVLLRLVWLLSELSICGILEIARRSGGLAAGK
jgi:glycosyltransferase 2 family protein